MNSLKNLEMVLINMNNEIIVDKQVAKLAQRSLFRMTNFKK